MFYIKNDVITLEFVKMYGFVTVWMSMDDRLYWVILLMYESHDMRHTGFHRLTVVNGTPGSGCHTYTIRATCNINKYSLVSELRLTIT